MRYALTGLALMALLVASCGDDDAERKAEAVAAVDEVREEFEAREAAIAKAVETAVEWRGKEGVPELEWGDRPPVKWFDITKNRYDDAVNGHIYELTEDGEFNTDPMEVLGLFTDTDWRDNAAKNMKAEGYLTPVVCARTMRTSCASATCA